MKLRIAALAAVALTALAGCAEQSPAAEPSTAPAKPASTLATPEASVADYAALIAEHHADWDEQVADHEGDCLDPDLVPACSLGYLTLGSKANVIHLSLTGAHKRGVPAYVGEVPAEIARLVRETESAADAVDPAVQELLDAPCVDPMDIDCLDQSLAADMAIEELSRKLDAWSAYSG